MRLWKLDRQLVSAKRDLSDPLGSERHWDVSLHKDGAYGGAGRGRAKPSLKKKKASLYLKDLRG